MHTVPPVKNKITFQQKDKESKIDVFIDGALFTSYIYPNTIKKPVLYPIMTKGGQAITRGYPLDPKVGERADHPHHIGFWLNYGDVNGLDFWNNSDTRPAEKKHKYGTIFHEKVLEIDAAQGKLVVETVWKAPAGQRLLKETTTFLFAQQGNTRSIDRITTLEALEEIHFKDNKEGMVAVRVARPLELPTKKPGYFIEANGQASSEKIFNNFNATGNYESSENKTGASVWGTRAKWMHLHGVIAEQPVALVLMDHPDNIGYPTYWHARSYGLFSANPLGQSIFSDGKETLNFKLTKGNTTTFKYRLLIHDATSLPTDKIEQLFQEWVKS